MNVISFDVSGYLNSKLERLRLIAGGSESVRISPELGLDRLDFLLYPAVVLDFLPKLVVLGGIVSLLLPHLRARYLERHFGLTAPPPSLLALTDIQRFIHRYDPTLEVKVNLMRAAAAPLFISPRGLRHAVVAVFGSFVIALAARPLGGGSGIAARNRARLSRRSPDDGCG